MDTFASIHSISWNGLINNGDPSYVWHLSVSSLCSLTELGVKEKQCKHQAWPTLSILMNRIDRSCVSLSADYITMQRPNTTATAFTQFGTLHAWKVLHCIFGFSEVKPQATSVGLSLWSGKYGCHCWSLACYNSCRNQPSVSVVFLIHVYFYWLFHFIGKTPLMSGQESISYSVLAQFQCFLRLREKCV